MRIRKHAKLSSIMDCGAEVLQAYVCELNQSPWDVMAFPPDTYPPPLHQLEEEDSFTGNGSLADSIGAVESSSAGSMMEDAEARPKFEPTVIDDDISEVVDNNGKKKRAVVDDCEDGKVGIGFKSRKGGKIVHCGHKNHGTGLHCRNEVKDGKTLCEHHWTMLKSTGNGAASGLASRKAEKGVNSGSRRGGRPRVGKGNKSVKSNPYEYYYYSGFGPLWGKRRGGGGGGGGGVGVGEDKGEGSKQTSEAKEDENGTNSSTAATNNTSAAASASPAVSSPGASSSKNTTPSSRSSSPIEEVELELDYGGEEEEEDVIDDDDDDEDDDDDDDDNNNNNNNNGDSGSKKRMRKPVKARSLKSLM